MASHNESSFVLAYFQRGAFAKEEVKANALRRSVWCRMIAFCHPLLFVAFVCALFILSRMGVQWGGIWGEWEDKPPVLTAVGLANGRAQLGHTSSCLPALLKRFSSCPLLPPRCAPFNFVRAVSPTKIFMLCLRADWALTTSEPNN